MKHIVSRIITQLYYKIIYSFADNPLHNISQALVIAWELAISLWRWSDIDNCMQSVVILPLICKNQLNIRSCNPRTCLLAFCLSFFNLLIACFRSASLLSIFIAQRTAVTIFILLLVLSFPIPL